MCLLTFLSGSGSRNMPVMHQSVSESVQPGDSVTLNCTIHTETCAGEHSVYWFRHGSGESHPGIIYTHGDRSDQCEKNPEAGSPTQSCVYNLPKRNLSLLMLGLTTVLWPHVGRYCLGTGPSWMLSVSDNSDMFWYYFMVLWRNSMPGGAKCPESPLLLSVFLQMVVRRTMFSWCTVWVQRWVCVSSSSLSLVVFCIRSAVENVNSAEVSFINVHQYAETVGTGNMTCFWS